MVRFKRWPFNKDVSFQIEASHPSYAQLIKVKEKAIEHMHRFRQITSSCAEAGGQLFGVVEENEIHMLLATGPYHEDERGRFHYRSNPEAAQRSISTQIRKGLLYLGEWHTHAEDSPSHSSDDLLAMSNLLKYSRLNTNCLFLLIIGRSTSSNGFQIICLGQGDNSPWNIHWAKP